MSWKDTNITNPGTSIKYGADDMELVSRLFNGQTSGIPAVTIKSTNKWGFWDNILFVRNQADSRSTTIRGQSNVPGTDVTLTLPPITANDVLPAIGISQIWGLVQEFDSGMQLKAMTPPGNPGAGIQHYYVDSADSHFKRKNSAGTVVDFDTQLAGLAGGSNKQIQYNSSGTFAAEAGFEYDAAVNEATLPGLTLTQNLIINGVISPPQIVANTDNYNPTGLATSTTLRLTTDASRNLTGIVAQPDGTIIVIHNVGSFALVIKDDVTSTAANRFQMVGDVTLSTDNTATFRYDGTSQRWRLIATDVVPVAAGAALLASVNTFTVGQIIEEDKNTRDHLTIKQKTNTVGDYAVITFQGKNASSAYFNLGWLKWQILVNTAGSESAEAYMVVRSGGNNITTTKWRSDGKLECGSSNRRIILDDSVETAQRTFTFPDIDTRLAGLAAAQTFTADQTFADTVTIDADLFFTNDISPSQITSNQNDYSPTGMSTAQRLRLDADSSFRQITGLATGADGRTLWLENISANTILLRNQSTGSSAANRFEFDGYDLPLFPKQMIKLIYDGTLSRWTTVDPDNLIVPSGRYGYYYRHDMFGTVADHTSSFSASGTGSANSVSAVTSVAAHPGVVQQQTGTTTTGGAQYQSTNQATILLGNNWYWRIEMMLRIPTASDGTNRFSVEFGFGDGAVGVANTDCLYANYADNVNSGNWRLSAGSNSTFTNNNTSTAPSINAWLRITIIQYPDNNLEIFQNGTSIGAFSGTNLPTGAGRGTGFYSGIFKSLGATSRNLDVDYIEVIGYANTVS